MDVIEDQNLEAGEKVEQSPADMKTEDCTMVKTVQGKEQAEITLRKNLELKPREPCKKVTEEKNEKKQAFNPSSEQQAKVFDNKNSDKNVTEVKSFV